MLSSLARSARRFAPACVVSVAAIAAFATPGVANAERFAKCSEGTAINGEGSTLQELAQKEVWAPGYAKFCPGAGAVTYNTKGKTGSGKGMENWYALKEFGPEAQAFVGTDNAPNAEIKTKIQEQQTAEGKGKLLTIPTLQAAVAIIVHLPKGCTVKTELAPGKKWHVLTLNPKQVEEIFVAKKTKFSQLTSGKTNVYEGAECTKAKKESHITRVVREDGSGTTATLKKWLEIVNGKAAKVVEGKTWLESAEEPPANTIWPEEKTDPVVRGNGSGGVVTKAEATEASIGYVNLANARKGAGFAAGGEGKEEFWALLANGQKEEVEAKKVVSYVSPATNAEEAAKGQANCTGIEYVTIDEKTGKAEKGKFPPPSVESTWNLVTAEQKQKKYPLCGFTYDLGLTEYKHFPGATEGEVTAAGDYLEYALSTAAEGGQTLLDKNQDYLGLPENENAKKNVLLIAQNGAKQIDY
jgi:ABC-type phosphate transport system substrate-binding protein